MQLTSRLTSGDFVAQIAASAASDVGVVRRINEDSYLASPAAFLVADGMGGHNAGDQASKTVRETFEVAVASGGPLSSDAVLEAIAVANAAVRRIGGGLTDRLSGTTLAGVAVVESGSSLHWMAFNIGDSRIYQWSGERLTQLSVDHSAVQELIDAGAITVNEAISHPDRNVITRAIGAADIVDADVWLVAMNGTQTFLLCSDGLSKELDDTALAQIFVDHDPSSATTLADEFVTAAVAAGGADNVTAIVVESRSLERLDSLEHTNERPVRTLEDTRPRY